MKKKSCLTLAVILVMAQLLTLFCVIPATAADGRIYKITEAENAITIDGSAGTGEWDSIAWSEAFTQNGTPAGTDATHTLQDGYGAKLKLAYRDEGGARYLYFYVEVTDTTVSPKTDWTGDAIWFHINDGVSSKFYTSTITVKNTAATDNTGNGGGTKKITYAIVDNRTTTGTYTVEAKYQLTNPGIVSVLFDVLVQDNLLLSAEDTGNRYARYAWGNLTQSDFDPNGVGAICYEICRVPAGSMTVDGKVGEGEAWDAAEWSDFHKAPAITSADDSHPAQTGFAAKLKAVVEDNGENAYLYLLVQTNDATYANLGNWLDDSFIFKVDENNDGTAEFTSAALWYPFRDVGYSNFTYAVDDHRSAGEGYTIEMRYTFADRANCTGDLRFDIFVQDAIAKAASGDGNRYARYAWDNITDGSHALKAISTVSDKMIFDVKTTAGASIRIDTATPELSGIRFRTTVDASAITALTGAGASVVTGTLLLPTVTLTENSIAADEFTKEGLAAKGLTEGEDFADIVNVGNDWVEGEPAGTFYGTLFNIKNFSREFSAIGYCTVTLAGGESYTLYGGYDADNSRSVSEVATLAMVGETEGEGGNYTAAQEAILQNFISGGTH